MRKAKGFILGLLVTGASAAAFLAVGALLLSNLDALPQRALLRGIVTLALCVSSFLGGVTGALVSGDRLLAACFGFSGCVESALWRGRFCASGSYCFRWLHRGNSGCEQKDKGEILIQTA